MTNPQPNQPTCQTCGGTGFQRTVHMNPTEEFICPTCNGTGKQAESLDNECGMCGTPRKSGNICRNCAPPDSNPTSEREKIEALFTKQWRGKTVTEDQNYILEWAEKRLIPELELLLKEARQEARVEELKHIMPGGDVHARNQGKTQKYREAYAEGWWDSYNELSKRVTNRIKELESHSG